MISIPLRSTGVAEGGNIIGNASQYAQSLVLDDGRVGVVLFFDMIKSLLIGFGVTLEQD